MEDRSNGMEEAVGTCRYKEAGVAICIYKAVEVVMSRCMEEVVETCTHMAVVVPTYKCKEEVVETCKHRVEVEETYTYRVVVEAVEIYIHKEAILAT